jgi:hypothetical protein
MKKIFYLLFLCSIAFSQTRTTTFKLPQWDDADTLEAGTKNDSTLANFGLNNGFYRIDAIIGRAIDSSGNLKAIRSTGSSDFQVNVGLGSATPVRIVLSDSLYGYYNWQTEGSILAQGSGYFGGNLNVGGYVSVDSIQFGSNLWIQNNLTVGGNFFTYGTIGSGSTISSETNITANTDILSAETLTINENLGGYAPTSGNQVKMYMKGDKFIIVYYDGVNFKYRYLDLSSTNATWTYTTTEP